MINDVGLLTFLAMSKLSIGFKSKRVKVLNTCTSELSHTLNCPVCTCACTCALVDCCSGIVQCIVPVRLITLLYLWLCFLSTCFYNLKYSQNTKMVCA